MGRRRHASISASFDAIRERILAGERTEQAADRGTVVLITAGSRGQGITSITIGLGRAFARGPACRTLVIDHDASASGIATRVGAVPKVVDVSQRPGVSSEIISSVHRPREEGFDLITLPPDYARTVDGAVREAVLKELRLAYDVILVDAGSLQTHAPLVWGRQVDQTILVVDTTVTTAAALERVKTDLQYADQTVTGVILNKRQLPVPDALYRRLR
jgi:Mrp family chromosome partitioning ATPase